MTFYRVAGGRERPRSNGNPMFGALADVWRNTLTRIGSIFGRLVYLSSLRDQNTGKYQHFGLAQIHGDNEADAALRQSHAETFAEWLCFDLEQQKADLDLYLSELATDLGNVLETWARLEPYRNLIPASAKEAERRLYLADLTTLLGVLRNEFAVPARECSPPTAVRPGLVILK
jgi:hypothetical protein